MQSRKTSTMDGNTASAYVSYAFTEVAAIYPITPSSLMAELIDMWSTEGRKNLFGQPVLVKEMQSEGGAAAALHGALQGGALASTYTASQGLLLMYPNMHKIAGELLPGVFHVSARSLASNALSIFGDHQDVMSVRNSGFGLIASSSVQQCMDMGAIAHLCAIESRLPFLHFFDGFRTSHEVQKIELLEYEELRELINMDAVDQFKKRALNPDNPVLRGTTQNPDVFFQTREAINKFYTTLPATVQMYMDKINSLTGRDYKLFNYYGSEKAENIIIAMGSGCEVIKETVDYMNANGGNYGLVEIHLYRPFSAEHLLEAIPSSVKRICVLDRTKEPGAGAEPLQLEIRDAFYNTDRRPLIIGGRYGLGSKDFTPAHVISVFENLESDSPRNNFTVGIVDDVTFTSLPSIEAPPITVPAGTTSCKFWGFGSDGTVGANKAAIKIIGDYTDLNVQAYYEYDAKKSGGLTISHLRFGKNKIKSSYLIKQADYVACHNQSYVHLYDMLSDANIGSTFLLNCIWKPEELEEKLPASMKKLLAVKKINFYIINAAGMAEEIGLGGRINMIMQSAFFKLSEIIPLEDAKKHLKENVVKSYGSKGKDVVEKNYAAIERGSDSMVKITVPEHWADIAVEESSDSTADMPDFVKSVVIPMNKQKGDDLPVSAFNEYEDGTYPTGITQYEKRGIALYVPMWNSENCIQCNQCAYVCPHAVLRPYLFEEDRLSDAPSTLTIVDAKGYNGMKYTLGISALDCTGCGNCADICPAKDKALVMVSATEELEKNEANWSYLKDIENPESVKRETETVKNSQFRRPLIEFSGACAGCGETPYAKLVTQLFGDRMMISNAAGCSTVWGGSAPGISYTKNNRGHGPSWGFSLFEDCAEYGFGMYIGVDAARKKLKNDISETIEKVEEPELKSAMQEWLEGFGDAKGTRERADRLTASLKNSSNGFSNEFLKFNNYFIKRSHWIFGGDGWAYDIGYGGVDHVLASGEDVNLLVFDTEVYSNTGGQSSKATPTAAVAQFAANGKKTCKKDLGLMAMSYGYVYVAQIAMGANKNQTLKAIQEAEAYPGPSLIIAYCPCVNHGIKAGMVNSQQQQKQAVEAGYWHLYRYDPRLKEEGKNPFMLDSKEPVMDYKEHLLSEVRYSSLVEKFPDIAKKLFAKAEADAAEKYDKYKRLAE